NAVVFQMSTATTDASAVCGSEIQACECERMWVRRPKSFTTPKMSSSIHFHICAATTVGIAHGTSITARIAPRPLKLELTTSAMTSPSTNSNETVSSVNSIVFQTECQKTVSW